MSEANKDSVHQVALAAESPEAGRSSTAAHTAGPWYSEPGHGGTNGTRIIGADGTRIATVTRIADKPISQKQADISLILAAPTMSAEIVRLKALNAEMLAALQAAIHYDDCLTNGTGNLDELHDDFQFKSSAAIARAGDA